MSAHDLTKFKQARLITKELEELRKLLKVQYKDLNKYKKYIPVKQILNEILGAEIILKLHEEKHLAILNNKGKIYEDKT